LAGSDVVWLKLREVCHGETEHLCIFGIFLL
jgi:hypothetical protein